MTSIKTPGGTGGIQTPSTPSNADGPTKPAGASFQERVEQTTANRGTEASKLQTTEAVVAELRAGKLPPEQAVSRLTELAIQRNQVPPALHPQIEQRIREWLANDPLVRELLRQMGTTPPREE